LDGERPVRIRAVMMVGNDSRPLGRYKDLATQRSLCTTSAASRYARLIFGGPFMQGNWTYLVGRHDMHFVGRGKKSNPFAFLQGGLILKYTFTPWPQVQSRLGQVGTRIPSSNRRKSLGKHHIQRMRPSFLNQSHQQMMAAEAFDLSDLYGLLRLSKSLPSDALAMLRSFHEAGFADMEPA